MTNGAMSSAKGEGCCFQVGPVKEMITSMANAKLALMGLNQLRAPFGTSNALSRWGAMMFFQRCVGLLDFFKAHRAQIIGSSAMNHAGLKKWK